MHRPPSPRPRLRHVLCVIVSSSCPQLPFYVAAQLAGSLLACLSANGVMEPRAEHFYGTVPMAGGDTRLPFLLELVASALLMVVIATAARGSVRLSLSSFLSVNLLRPSRAHNVLADGKRRIRQQEGWPSAPPSAPWASSSGNKKKKKNNKRR